MFKQVMTVMAMLATCLMVSGCNVKATLRTLVEKTYTVCTDTEQVVLKSSTAEFVTTVKLIQPPLKVVNNVLAFVNLKVTDVKVKEAIAKAIVAIDKINGIVDNITPEKVDQAKGEVIAALGEVKTSLKFIGAFVDAKFPTDAVVAANVTVAELTSNLDKSTKDLEDAFNKVK